MLLVIARDPAVRTRDIAAACRITERAAQRIVGDLEEAGYLSRKRDGRRTHCTLRPEGRLRHPAEALLSVGALLELFSADEGEPVRARGGTVWTPGSRPASCPRPWPGVDGDAV
ncbi:MarR family winged helix-turn-helix transcriptional regulator, partial [Streptomyces hydrogenans]|uniref:MarR family winged helix-turn-helix transcriptional regulator n=1 Tax=Streptomyces hydrogenans TaxID=1873719 RepID=UPI001CFC7871